MVPLSDALAIPLALVLQSLQRHASERLALPSPESAFAACFFRDEPGAPSSDVVAADPRALDRGESPALAIEGFRLWNARERDAGEMAAGWAAAMKRLTRRDPFPSDRQTFAFRFFELVGIAAGVAATGLERDWIQDVLHRMEDGQALSTRQHLAACIAASLLRLRLKREVLLDPEVADIGDLAIARWEAERSDSPIRLRTAGRDADAGRALLKRALLEPLVHLSGADALILARHLRSAARTEIDGLVTAAGPSQLKTSAAVEEVAALCRRFDAFVRALSRRRAGRSPWSIADEYDVQDVLHGLLLTRFDDVRPEEWTPSYAGRSSRTDFLLYREEVFVEAKKTRPNLGDREVIEQLSIDFDFYRRHPRCGAIVCFVYDPERRLLNAAAIESDLSGIRNGIPVRVVVCPSDLVCAGGPRRTDP